MKKILLSLFVILTFCFVAFAQNMPATNTAPEAKPKKPSFRATKDQISQAQKILKLTETGKLSPEDRDAVKAYQDKNGLKTKGSLNRATLEKMGIPLTEKQKEIPVSEDSVKKDKKAETGSADKPKKAVFRAGKDQISAAQKILKMAETGKLSKEDHEALKVYQAANGIKPTGGLNKATLEKMGITLTDKQKEM